VELTPIPISGESAALGTRPPRWLELRRPHGRPPPPSSSGLLPLPSSAPDEQQCGGATSDRRAQGKWRAARRGRQPNRVRTAAWRAVTSSHVAPPALAKRRTSKRTGKGGAPTAPHRGPASARTRFISGGNKASSARDLRRWRETTLVCLLVRLARKMSTVFASSVAVGGYFFFEPKHCAVCIFASASRCWRQSIARMFGCPRAYVSPLLYHLMLLKIRARFRIKWQALELRIISSVILMTPLSHKAARCSGLGSAQRHYSDDTVFSFIACAVA
jgi:hypothetical protein